MNDTRTVETGQSGLTLDTLRIEVVQGKDRGMVHQAERDVVSVGTAQGNHLLLSDDTVSRYHLEIRRKADRIWVQDLGSTNGTVCGPARIERASIPPGAVLNLGRTAIKVDHGAPSLVDLYPEPTLGGLCGRARAMQMMMNQIERSAKSDASVMVLGETGTGKELIAQAIHSLSPRSSKSFESVDCGSLMPTLIASELFGHERGAFTGADRQYIGAFERAHGGTLFLDEIGELPAELQPALLGALERRRIRRVGGEKMIDVDLRIVCATHRDLRAEVNAGRFRQDLYFRLAIVTLEVPPLRERLEDIPLLVEHFLRRAGYEGPVEQVISGETLRSLEQHQWPGNVRELRNFVEATLALGETPELIGSGPRPGPGPGPGLEGSGFDALVGMNYSDAKARLLESFEAHYLRAILERAKGNITAAARNAGMNRSHLADLMRRHGLR